MRLSDSTATRLAARVLPLAASLALSALAHASNVWTVDDNGGADFTSIASAIAASASGDIVLVRPGAYAGFALPNATLSIVASAGAGTARVLGPVQLAALDSARSIALHGLSLERGSSALDAQLSGGVLVLQDCVIASTEAWQSGVGARIGGFGAAHIVNCVLLGASSVAAPASGALALHASGVELALRDSLVRGGAGANGTHDPHLLGSAGGHAIVLHGGSLHASACAFSGGNGGNGAFVDGSFGQSWCGPGGGGGAGLSLDAGASATLLGCSTSGGAGGFGPSTCTNGMAGVAEQSSPGAVVHASATPCRLIVPAVLHEGAQASVRIEGASGGLALLALGSAPGWTAWNGLVGPFALGNLSTVLALAPLGAGGELALPSFTVQELAFGVLAAPVWAQPIVCEPNGACVLGGPRVTLLIDATL